MEQMGKGSLGPGRRHGARRASVDGVRHGDGDLPLIARHFLYQNLIRCT